MRELRIGRKCLVLSQGDITECDADAVVNAANNHLWMGAGVAGAIKRKGGASIESEAVAQGPIPVGEAVITGAGFLRARHVIHAAGMGQDLRTSEDDVEACTAASLRRAEENALSSIAFPAIGTGVGGLAAGAVARRMIQVAAAHLKSQTGSVQCVSPCCVVP